MYELIDKNGKISANAANVIVIDTTTYTLSNGDYLHLQSTQPDTTYYISTEVL
jgi:hypothetical protein